LYAYFLIGLTISEQHKKKLSLRMLGSNNPIFGIKGPLAPGYHKTGPSNHMYGKKHTLEARKIISEKAKLRHQNDTLHPTTTPVKLINLKTKTTELFKGLMPTAKFIGYDTSQMIRKALKDPNLTLRDQWRVIPLTQEEYLAYFEKHQK